MTTDRVTALLDAYDAETAKLPLGHEKPTTAWAYRDALAGWW